MLPTSKTLRSWDVDQSWLLPRCVHDLVPSGHLAHFVRDTVREALDLSAILQAYGEERGQPPYHPGMLVALLLYGYSRGVYSSHQLARAYEERMDLMAVTGLNRPDFRTISDFRKRHLADLSDLFVQVLRLCQRAGLVKLGHVAVDGTKLRSNGRCYIYRTQVRYRKICARMLAVGSVALVGLIAGEHRIEMPVGGQLAILHSLTRFAWAIPQEEPERTCMAFLTDSISENGLL